MIVDLVSNKKRNQIVTELFITGRKLNISLVFVIQSYLKVREVAKLNSTYFFILKILNK